MKYIISTICIVTLLSNFLYMLYGTSSKNKTNPTKNIFIYKTPDGTIWINKDKEALQRMRNHFINESDDIITRLEAEKQRVIPYNLLESKAQQMLLSSYDLNIETRKKGRILDNLSINFLIFNSLIIASGFSLFYLVSITRRSVGTNKAKPATPQSVSKPIYEKNIMNNDTLNKVKDIICEILEMINKYSDNCITPKNDKLESFTTDRIPKIRASVSLDEFLKFEDEINKIIPSHFETTRNLIKVKFSEIKTLINDLAEDLQSITKDNTDFSGQIKTSMSHIEKAIGLDEIKEIRKKITGEVGKMGKIITKKQERDREKIDLLSHKVKTLDTELLLAKEEIMIDGLTQLYNRKAFDRKLNEAFEKNSGSKKSFTLIMSDIDYFKKVNDDYGHMVGDEVLKKIARTIKGTFRLNDFAARYGGEEFVILIDRVDRQHVHGLCERLRSDIETLNFKIENEKIPTSISIGVAFYKESDTPEVLLNRADKTLYLAKQSGRNIVKTEEQLSAAKLENISQ